MITTAAFDPRLAGPADLPRYQFVAVRPSGAGVAELTEARARRVSFALDDAATATFTIPGRHPQAALVDELETDLVVARNGSAIFLGRVNASDDQIGADAHDVTFSAVDYRGMLDRRMIWPGSRKAFTATDQGLIVKALVDDTQRLGTLRLTFGNMATGVLRDRTYDDGQTIGELIGNLGRCIGGFEWDVSPTRQLRIFYPQRGNPVPWVLEYGANVTDVRRTVQSSDFANAIRYSGADTIAATTRTVAPGIEGRFERQFGDPDIKLAPTLAQNADAKIVETSTIVPSYDVTLLPGAYDLARAWLGDTVRLLVRSGRLDVDTSYRITGVDVELDDEGVETVGLTLGTYRGTFPQRLAGYQGRLDRLERR
jgi:hypothetical protein